MTSVVVPVLWSLPWVLPPLIGLARSRNSRKLDDFPEQSDASSPSVTVIIPARNEARNIATCVRSVLASRYPALEVVVVDDHSSDGTGRIAREIAATDPRLRVLDAPDLPAGWFGKQWACTTAANLARSEILVFTDADTRHAADLLPRAVNAMRARNADLLTLAGDQEMHTFWERVIQPQMFAMIAIRFGGTEHVSNTRRPSEVIANGQFIAVRRTTYEAVGGHALVHNRVDDDLSLAQEFVRAGHRMVLLFATGRFSTRMYTSLREIVGGWRKNIYAGGRRAAFGGAVGQALYPLMLLGLPLMGLAPPAALALSLAGILSTSWLVWSLIAVAAALLFWFAIYYFMETPIRYALLYPLGMAMIFYIAAGAVRRGRRVEWKSRQYESA